MPILRRVNASLDLKLLNGVDGGQGDVCVEVYVGVIDAIQRVVIKEDPLSAGGNRLVGAITTLTRACLPGRRRQYIHVRGKRYQVQVLAAVQRKFGNDLVVDHRAKRRILCLQQIGVSGNFYTLTGLPHLECDIEPHCLLHLNFESFTCRLKARNSNGQLIGTWRDRWKRVDASICGHGVADRVCINVNQCNGGCGYYRS